MRRPVFLQSTWLRSRLNFQAPMRYGFVLVRGGGFRPLWPLRQTKDWGGAEGRGGAANGRAGGERGAAPLGKPRERAPANAPPRTRPRALGQWTPRPLRRNPVGLVGPPARERKPPAPSRRLLDPPPSPPPLPWHRLFPPAVAPSLNPPLPRHRPLPSPHPTGPNRAARAGAVQRHRAAP
jgi:hypothetical protein